MEKQRDLLPWILGGLCVAAIAVAYAAVSTHRDVSIVPPQVVAARPATLVQPAASVQHDPSLIPTAAQAASPADEPNPAPVSAPPQAQAAVEPEVPGGQIWECTTKGVKTFSNNPCGDKSTLLDVGPINTMRATPASDYVRAYGSQPRYAAGYPDQSVPADADDYSNQYAADSGADAYIVGVVRHRRPQHVHRPPAPPSHHKPPVRRY